ncbi:uncharacterized protein LY89DRAFT_147386 [Mollisia scopiformis]|uniref:Secreted protein n=1 Tax=Mollisia scopiformis TaxID=149040 RepID=A0A194X1E8_MOLSC|nr:uncharacterized protein LY89DRAFT_147386 [Mollisia scopiformis]KUJ13799.1 hypothetical protein LY89DRAFT_147386 [Mollisia scopiformis]
MHRKNVSHHVKYMFLLPSLLPSTRALVSRTRQSNMSLSPPYLVPRCGDMSVKFQQKNRRLSRQVVCGMLYHVSYSVYRGHSFRVAPDETGQGFSPRRFSTLTL